LRYKILLPASVLVILGFVFLTTNKVLAQGTQGGYPPIIQKLVQKFGLAENEVKAVFDEERRERQAKMQAEFEEKLNQAVKAGKLTETQKQAILAKHKEIVEKKWIKPENWQTMTREQRRQYMETQRQELENWAKQNSIDLQYLFGGFGKGFGKTGRWQGN